MPIPARRRARRIDRRRRRSSCCAGRSGLRTGAIAAAVRGLRAGPARSGVARRRHVLVRRVSASSSVHSFQTTLLCSRGAPLRPGFCIFASLTRMRGGRSAERRSGVCETPVGHAMTRRVRRLRGALRPMTRDARLSALHRGGFRHRVRAFQSPNARLRRSFGRHPDPSQRAPRSQVIVPDGRGPGPPGAAVTSRHRGTPLLAPPSGCLRTTPLKERGCESCSMDAGCSQ
jgi:hypothetical protein